MEGKGAKFYLVVKRKLKNLCVITCTCTMLDFNHYIYIYQSNALPRSQSLTITFIHQSNTLPRSQPACITCITLKKKKVSDLMNDVAVCTHVQCTLSVMRISCCIYIQVDLPLT